MKLTGETRTSQIFKLKINREYKLVGALWYMSQFSRPSFMLRLELRGGVNGPYHWSSIPLNWRFSHTRLIQLSCTAISHSAAENWRQG